MTNSNVTDLGTRARARQDVAAAVRAHMAVRGIKDTELARNLGWSQSYASRRTNAAIAFSTDDLGLMADHFGISLAEIVQMPTARPGGGSNLHGVTPIRPRVLGVVGSAGFEPTTSTV